MRIIAVATLREFWSRPGRRDAEQPLRAWVHVVRAADWSKPTDVKHTFRSADILANGRVIFDIGGNKYSWLPPFTIGESEFMFGSSARTKSTTGSMPGRSEEQPMEIRPIRTKADYRAALREVEGLWEAEPGTPAGDRVDVLVTLIEAYEAEHHPIPAPDPIAAIEFMMQQKGLTRRDLEPAIGSRGRVSEILTRKRPLTLPMVRALSRLLDIPSETLVQPYETQSVA